MTARTSGGRYRAVIFDLDGTLTYTLDDLMISVNHALSLMGLPTRTLDEIRSFVGNGVGRLVRLAMGGGKEGGDKATGSIPRGSKPEGGTPSEEDYQRCLALFREHYVQHCFDHTRLYPGVSALLGELRHRGIPTAIVSNKLQAGVDELYDKWFDATVAVAIGEREGMRRKPAPDMVEAALRALGARREETLYVGDSEVDIQTARASGLRCISVLWGFRGRAELEAAGATEFIESPPELLAYLEA